MDSSTFVLSIPASPDRDDDVWCQQAWELGRFLFHSNLDFSLELKAKRFGQGGHFEDNPPISRIDSLIRNAEDKNLQFGSYFVPVNLNRSENEIGAEISAVNGWTDLAVYTGAFLARIKFASLPDFSQQAPRNALQQIFHYMFDMDLAVSISVEEKEEPIFLSLIQSLDHDVQKRVGFNRHVSAESLEQTWIKDLDDSTIQSVSTSILSSSHAKVLEKIPDWINQLDRENTPATVVMVENPSELLSS